MMGFGVAPSTVTVVRICPLIGASSCMIVAPALLHMSKAPDSFFLGCLAAAVAEPCFLRLQHFKVHSSHRIHGSSLGFEVTFLVIIIESGY